MEDNMQGAARVNSIEVRGRQAGKAAEQKRRVDELRAQGVDVDTVSADTVLDGTAPRRVIPAWQYRELAGIEGLDMSAFEADETQQEKPRGQERFYSNRAMRRAAAKTRRAKGGRRIF